MDTSRKRKRGVLSQLISGLLVFLCVLVLGVLFYCTMVYQASETVTDTRTAQIRENSHSHGQFPGAVLALGEGTLLDERMESVRVSGQSCTVLTRTYLLNGGVQATAVSATPPVYIERLMTEGWQPQLIAGYVVGEMDAVYELLDQRGMLAARQGDFVYLIELHADEQTAYELGASAYLE